MAQQKRASSSAARSTRDTGITADRFGRLCLLVKLVDKAPQTRTTLLRRLRTDIRGFYRDLEALRNAGVEVTLEKQRYRLVGRLAANLGRIPFPDPHFLYADVLLLTKGDATARQKLRQRCDEWMP